MPSPVPASPPRRRRAPWFELIGTTLGLAVATVATIAVVRALTAPHKPVLPVSWCRPESLATLPPMLGSALLTQWHVDAIALIVLGVAAALYALGVLSVRRSGGRWPAQRGIGFLGGLVVCMLATNSSVAVYDMALFSAHMVGHLMLVMLAPVLLCIGRPMELMVQAASAPWSDRLARFFGGRLVSLLLCPPVALATYAAVIVTSHLTGVMDQIMQRPWAGQLEHLVYVLVGMQFFTLLVGDSTIRWQLTTAARWLLLLLSMAVDTFTGVVLMMSTQPVAMVAVPGFDVNPLADTHTAGAIMWVGGDGLMAAVMIWLTISFLRQPAMRERDRTGLLEQARQTVFAAHTGGEAPAVADADFDEEEANRERYNRWLASLDNHG